MDTIEVLEPGFSWGEKNFSSSESLISDKNLSSIREFIILFASVIFLSLLFGSLIVVNNIAHFFLNVFNDFDFCVCGKAIASLI